MSYKFIRGKEKIVLGKKQEDSSDVLCRVLEQNIIRMEALFEDVDTIRSRRFQNRNNGKLSFCIYYFEGLTDSMTIGQQIIRPLMAAEIEGGGARAFAAIKDKVIINNEVKEVSDIAQIIEAITYGDTLLMMDGCSEALLIGSKKFTLRAIGEPEGERVLTGPREGFTEGIMQNLSMIRRRLLTNDLKLHFIKVGQLSKTSVCVAYMDSIVNKKILDELYRRLDKIDIDAVLDSNYLVEHIAEGSVYGFNTIGATERPDVVTGKLLEGRIALFADGSPVVLTLPYLFIESFQSSEDYYMNPIYAGFARVLRMLCFAATTMASAAYIAMVGFHHEILPSALMISFAGERAGVPLPAAVECFIMLLLFDILREAGVRMPNHVGQAMSIVGALVIGQAAVEAELVAAPMIIIVAFTGITILLVPRLTTASLVGRYFCLLFASTMGLAGLMVAVSILIIHVINLHSFGVPYILPVKNLAFQEVKDIVIRAPWPKMLTRTRPFTSNIIRQKVKK